MLYNEPDSVPTKKILNPCNAPVFLNYGWSGELLCMYVVFLIPESKYK